MNLLRPRGANKPWKNGLMVEAKWVLLGQAGTAVLSLASIRLITELLDVAVFGDAALILAGLVLAKGLFLSPILAGQVRFDPAARSKGTLGELYKAVASLGALGLVAASLGWALIARFGGVLPGMRASSWLIIVAIGWLASDAVLGAAFHLLNATRQQGRLAAARIADGLVRPAFGIVLILTLSANALPYIGGRVIGATLLALLLVAYARRGLDVWRWSQAGNAAVRDWFGQLIKYGAPLVPVAGTQWVIHLADRYILEAFHGSAEVGVYAAAYGLASQPFLMLGGSLALLLRPYMFEAASDARVIKRYKIHWLRWLITLGVLGLVLMATFHIPLGRLLLAPAYRKGSSMFVIIGAGYLLLAIGQVYEVLLQVRKSTSRVLTASVVSMLVSLLCALLLIPPFAAQGAAWATLLGLASYAAASSFAARRE